MEHEYRISMIYKILYGIAAAALAGFGVFLLTVKSSPDYSLNGIIISIVLFIGSFLFARYVFKRKVIVSDEEIIVTGAFGRRQIYFNDIKGFRKNGKAIFIYPLTQRRKVIINDYSALSDEDGLIEWFTSNLRDLDDEEFEEGKAIILQDSELGFTTEEREKRFLVIHRISLGYGLLAFILLMISIFYHEPSVILSTLLFIMPIGGLALMALSKGLVRLSIEKKSSPYSSIFISMIMLSAVLIFVQIVNNSFLDLKLIWPTVIITAVILAFLMGMIALKQPNPTLLKQVIYILIIAAAYAFGSVHYINMNLDNATPKVYTATVTDKYVKREKSTSYHVNFTGWGALVNEDHLSVSPSVYDKVSIGSTVTIKLKPGKFNIPWYYIEP